MLPPEVLEGGLHDAQVVFAAAAIGVVWDLALPIVKEPPGMRTNRSRRGLFLRKMKRLTDCWE